MMTPAEVLELGLKTDRWIAARGSDELLEIQRRAEEERKAIREALRPDPETMRQPMTI